MNLQNKYIELRTRYVFVLYLMAAIILIISVMVWKNAIFFVVGLFFLLSKLEYFFVKCPNCKKRPTKLFRSFPSKVLSVWQTLILKNKTILNFGKCFQKR